MKALLRLFFPNLAAADDAALLDHVAIKPERADWRDEKLREAQAKLGKPWKCGPADMKREVLDHGTNAYYVALPKT